MAEMNDNLPLHYNITNTILDLDTYTSTTNLYTVRPDNEMIFSNGETTITLTEIVRLKARIAKLEELIAMLLPVVPDLSILEKMGLEKDFR